MEFVPMEKVVGYKYLDNDFQARMEEQLKESLSNRNHNSDLWGVHTCFAGVKRGYIDLDCYLIYPGQFVDPDDRSIPIDIKLEGYRMYERTSTGVILCGKEGEELVELKLEGDSIDSDTITDPFGCNFYSYIYHVVETIQPELEEYVTSMPPYEV